MSNIKLILTQLLESHNKNFLLFNQAIIDLSKSLKPFSAGKDPIFNECRNLINELTSFLQPEAELRTRMWHLTTGTNSIPTCNMCNTPVKWDRATQAYRPYCSILCKSHDPIVKAKTAATNIQKYGAVAPTQNKEIQEKVKQTQLEHYGCHPRQTEEVKNKQKQTNLIKYGFDIASKAPGVKEKTIQTNLERFGGPPQLNKEVQQKTIQTNLERFGGHPKQTKIVQDKFKATCLNTYGFDNPTKSPIVREKVKQTNLKKFGIGNANYIKNSHVLDILPQLNDLVWLFDQYTTQGKTSNQIAEELGVGGTTILRNLHKQGIGITPQSNVSAIGNKWLNQMSEELSITIIPEYPFNPDRKGQRADGYCKETNTIYEFYGDYWHGNPNVYEPEFINQVNYKTMGEAYQATIERENKIKELGYNLITIWESDFKI